MAEDEEFVRVDRRTQGFASLGPGSHTVQAAGFKDEAKRTAEQVDVSVTPGINNATARLISVAKAPGPEGAEEGSPRNTASTCPSSSDSKVELADRRPTPFSPPPTTRASTSTPSTSSASSSRSRSGGILKDYSGQSRSLEGDRRRRRQGPAHRAARPKRPLRWSARSSSEVKALGVGDNKNILVELNIETTRHNEIQLIGNGEWCIAGRSRLLAPDARAEAPRGVDHPGRTLLAAVERERDSEATRPAAAAIEQDLNILRRMEAEAERFGEGGRLDSASTFECIVDGDRHYFMEVNTRIQVEHRVSELCYALRFTNPDDPERVLRRPLDRRGDGAARQAQGPPAAADARPA